MTETTVYCDRCRARIEAGRTLANIECGPLRGRLPTIDLCPSCAAGLLEWLRPSDAATEKTHALSGSPNNDTVAK